MGCESCKNRNGGTPAGCKSNGTCASGGCDKLAVYDWLGNMELPGQMSPFEYIEVRFKSNRKEFFRNATKTQLNPGDAIVVEGSPGYDLGIVSASGELARLQMGKKKALKNTRDLKKTLRRSSTEDLTKWRELREKEADIQKKARTISSELGLEMKISDVEFQGDGSKATFYYTADGRVDFRELIKRFADTFRVRVEMKQIGSRQEAGRLGGIGSCGRELCCSTWLTDFRSVSTSAARYQQLALNTQKLAGQCGKLKCCLNFELDSYLDALSGFPKNFNKLKTKKGTASHLKTDIFKGIMWYVYDEGGVATPAPIEKDRVKEILAMNADGEMPQDLRDFMILEAPKEIETYSNVVGQDSLTRFDEKKSKRGSQRRKPANRKGGGKGPQGNRPSGQNKQQAGPKQHEGKKSRSSSNKRRRPNKPNPNATQAKKDGQGKSNSKPNPSESKK